MSSDEKWPWGKCNCLGTAAYLAQRGWGSRDFSESCIDLQPLSVFPYLDSPGRWQQTGGMKMGLMAWISLGDLAIWCNLGRLIWWMNARQDLSLRNQNGILWNLTRKIWHLEVQTTEPDRPQWMTRLNLICHILPLDSRPRIENRHPKVLSYLHAASWIAEAVCCPQLPKVLSSVRLCQIHDSCSLCSLSRVQSWFPPCPRIISDQRCQ